MGIVAVYVIYLLSSLALTVVTGIVLARGGKIVLTHVFGGDESLGRAVTSLFVAGSTLLNLGFVILAMRTSASVHDARQAVELLSVKLGEVLLIIGALYIGSVLVLARIGRHGGGPRPDPWRPAPALKPDQHDRTPPPDQNDRTPLPDRHDRRDLSPQHDFRGRVPGLAAAGTRGQQEN
jgi:hypothetical protein